MSLASILFDDRLLRNCSTILDQNFGLDLLNNDLFPQAVISQYYRPWRYSAPKQSGTATMQVDKGFHVNLDVQQFKPEEVSVRHMDNNVIVEGKHEEKQDDHGFISRHFVRRYILPENVDSGKLECKISSDGVLSIHAPIKVAEGMQRSIPIICTNEPAMKLNVEKKTPDVEEKKTAAPEDEAAE